MEPALCRRAAGIELAAKDGMDWILHIDTDELVYPGGGPEYSIQRVLAAVPPDVDTMVFPNYESLPERDDVQDPFTEVGGLPASWIVWEAAGDPVCPSCASVYYGGTFPEEQVAIAPHFSLLAGGSRLSTLDLSI